MLSVVLFHFDRHWLSGGFAGVDVFFVISGFLITGVIHREIADRRFSIIAFYERRIRRIYPALLATLLVTLVAGFILFMPDELRDLGASTVAAIAFSSNILFWMQTDYFAGAADLKPLLHTWSLAVEEQYYIVIPPLMLLVHRWWPGKEKGVLAALALISFALSCAMVSIDASGNYYLPFTRSWELLIGALVSLGAFPPVRSRAWAEALAAIGIAALLAPLIMLDESSAFPAWNALPTCIGTALLIHTGGFRSTVASRILSLGPMVWVGLLSYSIYLVHWPLIVFVRYQMLGDVPVFVTILLVAATILLGWLSWRFVERPFRDKARWPRKRLFLWALVGSAALAIIGGVTFAARGFPQRLGTRAALAHKDRAQEAPTGCFMKGDWRGWRADKCYLIRGEGRPTLLWGDSHANHFAPTLRANKLGFTKPVLLFASAGCPPVLDVAVPHRKDCAGNNAQVLRIIKAYNVDRVILSSYWENVLRMNDISLSAVARSVAKLQAAGVDVRVIGNNPDFPFSDPQYLTLRLSKRSNPNASFYSPVRNDFAFNPALRAALPGVPFYDPMDRLCNADKCLAYQMGKTLTTDSAHLSGYGSALLLRDMGKFFD